ncbi:MAG: SIR2 family protein [Planctomycetota bacterium]
MQIPVGLIDAVRQRRAVLLAGAGISYNAVKVGGLELRNWIGAEIQKDDPKYDFQSRSLENVCDEYELLHDRPTLVDLLAGQIPQNVEPLPSHIAAVQAFRFIVTTNWDILFEAAYRKIGQRYQILMEEADAPMFNYDQHNLLKIHGSIDRPRSLVCTTDDYEGYADTHPQLLDRVGDLLYNNTVLFVGHGLRDEHLRRLLYQIRRRRGDLQRRNYVVGFYDEVRTRLLESRKMEVIQADAERFLPELQKAAQ